MTTVTLKGVPVDFPFEPYDLQKNYMEKVIECLQNESHGILESPTGTGKTLSLLCSSLAWLQVKKAQIQAQRLTNPFGEENEFLAKLNEELGKTAGKGGKSNTGRAFIGLPTIIYASRTHTQLAQAMQELKRTAYKHMKASILGSRDQLCIHPEVSKEANSGVKIQLCRLKVKTRSCNYHNRIERKKDDPDITQCNIIDIEDIMKMGEKHKFCPYYMTKELKQQADIVFMPYNYLLDPRARKALGVELSNNIVILDEAHNVERICEDSASIQIKSTDIAVASDDVTAVMKAMSEDSTSFDSPDVPKDFTADELCILKQMILDFESALDQIPLKNDPEGTSYEGSYIYELFEKAKINHGNSMQVTALIEKIVSFLATANSGPFQRSGSGLSLFEDLIRVVFADASSGFRDKVNRCFKVHVACEEPKKKRQDNWLTKATAKASCRILSFWCFSPGFGMNSLVEQGVKCVILTSGTLAPLKPLISELELKVEVRLENPHIVKGDQVCVKILTHGPDKEQLICNYNNRDNPKYINSLGRTILNVTKVIPNGLLIFFPSYPIMLKCNQSWQETGIWTSINDLKPIYVEPRDKDSFNVAMAEFYAKVNDVKHKGAIFMGVCRGKVSEGLDFADANGRAVIVTGIPFPPLKDPKVILKKRYLDTCNSTNKEYLNGNDWYSLEATRAVNQAIGRVIRHRFDYGAILLLDSRFNSAKVKSQLSLWLRDHIKVMNNFGEIIKDLCVFYRNAGIQFEGKAPERVVPAESTEFENKSYKKGNFDFSTNSIGKPTGSSTNSVTQRRSAVDDMFNPSKRKKIVIKSNESTASVKDTSHLEYTVMVKKSFGDDDYKQFISALQIYRNSSDFGDLAQKLDKLFGNKPGLTYLIHGLERYIKSAHKEDFQNYVKKIN